MVGWLCEQDGGLALRDAAPPVEQTVEEIKGIVAGARVKSAALQVGGCDVVRACVGGRGDKCMVVYPVQFPVPSRFIAHKCPVPCPTHTCARVFVLCLQPTMKDFNEEDYMDGDLLDEELVE